MSGDGVLKRDKKKHKNSKYPDLQSALPYSRLRYIVLTNAVDDEQALNDNGSYPADEEGYRNVADTIAITLKVECMLFPWHFDYFTHCRAAQHHSKHNKKKKRKHAEPEETNESIHSDLISECNADLHSSPELVLLAEGLQQKEKKKRKKNTTLSTSLDADLQTVQMQRQFILWPLALNHHLSLLTSPTSSGRRFLPEEKEA